MRPCLSGSVKTTCQKYASIFLTNDLDRGWWIRHLLHSDPWQLWFVFSPRMRPPNCKDIWATGALQQQDIQEMGVPSIFTMETLSAARHPRNGCALHIYHGNSLYLSMNWATVQILRQCSAPEKPEMVFWFLSHCRSFVQELFFINANLQESLKVWPFFLFIFSIFVHFFHLPFFYIFSFSPLFFHLLKMNNFLIKNTFLCFIFMFTLFCYFFSFYPFNNKVTLSIVTLLIDYSM